MKIIETIITDTHAELTLSASAQLDEGPYVAIRVEVPPKAAHQGVAEFQARVLIAARDAIDAQIRAIALVHGPLPQLPQ